MRTSVRAGAHRRAAEAAGSHRPQQGRLCESAAECAAGGRRAQRTAVVRQFGMAVQFFAGGFVAALEIKVGAFLNSEIRKRVEQVEERRAGAPRAHVARGAFRRVPLLAVHLRREAVRIAQAAEEELPLPFVIISHPIRVLLLVFVNIGRREQIDPVAAL